MLPISHLSEARICVHSRIFESAFDMGHRSKNEFNEFHNKAVERPKSKSMQLRFDDSVTLKKSEIGCLEQNCQGITEVFQEAASHMNGAWQSQKE